MRFIFPKNYTTRFKFFGLLDYTTVLVNLVWAIFLFCLFNLLFSSFFLKAFLLILFTFPLLLFSILGFGEENILSVFFYFISFYRNRKIIFYQ